MRHQVRIGVAGLATAFALVTAPIGAAVASAHPIAQPVAPIDGSGSADLDSALGFGSGAPSAGASTGSGNVILSAIALAFIKLFNIPTGSGVDM